MDKKVGEIYETQDYQMFKHLEGNRTDATSRGAKIIDSIRKHGYIMSPIAINENKEVIDGQGRLYALECEGLPVHYYIVPGAGIDECIAMNIYGTKWKINDYIESYSMRGYQDYIELQKLREQYPAFDLDTIIAATTGKSVGDRISDKYIKAGDYKLPEENVRIAKGRLDYISRIVNVVNEHISGSKRYLYKALMFIYDQCPGDFDRDKIITKIELLYSHFPAIADVDSALKAISEVYNYKSRTEKMYFDVEYDKYMCAHVPGYSGKWSKARR